ncbi:hypothetical protein GBZ26_08335 [Azospirillum formosense]|uniref:Uncharacterized protein n=1 Tax=Azospirillum formosense TaxID=861533 RepID=A0ABX2KU25_9PROT|nr:hypothetical protein [Azospirillum formosense]MBY3756756.1 hypothetical protein [Azospirillum formosense]NUB19219.1 hypothetical protein [Azospirillum formosense]
MTTLREALDAVLAAQVGGLKLSRIVAYALGDGDAASRFAFEKFGPDLRPQGAKKGTVWLPAAYTETLDAAGKPLPAGWLLSSGIDREGPFAVALHEEREMIRETAATETLARLAATLRARLEEEEDMEALLS